MVPLRSAQERDRSDGPQDFVAHGRARTKDRQTVRGWFASELSLRNTTSRLQQVIDENSKSTFYTYNPDDTVSAIVYGNTAVPTPNVSFSYDPNYPRVVSMTDGIGTTTYNYIPITSPPCFGRGKAWERGWPADQ
jgi:hypothetical protein